MRDTSPSTGQACPACRGAGRTSGCPACGRGPGRKGWTVLAGGTRSGSGQPEPAVPLVRELKGPALRDLMRAGPRPKRSRPGLPGRVVVCGRRPPRTDPGEAAVLEGPWARARRPAVGGWAVSASRRWVWWMAVAAAAAWLLF